MKTKLFKAFALLLIIPLLATVAKGQSAYSNLVMSLNPVAYWPLQESIPAPRYDMETNYGSLGAIGNMYYYSEDTFVTNFGAFPGDSSPCTYFPSGNSKGAIVPTTDNRVGLPFTQQFTVEGWFRLTGTGGYAGIINQTGGQGSGGINDTATSAGWELVNVFSPYRTATPNSPSVFAFHVFNGTNSTGGADVEVTNAAAGEWLTGGNTGYANSWVYLACVFDGTNAWMYMFSTNLNTASGGPGGNGYGGTNGTVYQIPISSGINTAYFGTPTPTTYTNFVADVWDPIVLGETRSYNGNDDFNGYMQDVAIYTNALSSLQISNHFNAGTNGLGNYQATILADNPFMHWRMNAPLWTNNLPESTFPVAYNYGSAASTFTNNNSGVSGADSAIYQPGTLPGYPGLTGAGFGPFTNCCAFNGLEGVVDVGVSPAINPTGFTNNYSLIAWFKGNPMDSLGTRYQCPVSHGALSWKAQFHEGTTEGATIGSGTSATIAPNATTFYPNDGKWHMYALVATYANLTTNFSVYLDGGAASVTLKYPVGVPGSNTMDAFIGGDPDPQYMEPTNYSTFNSSEQELAGQVAHVAFFNYALSPSQLSSLYVTANPVPTITQQPMGGNADLDGTFTNTVIVSGNPPFYYQWFTNSIPIAGATTNTYIINPVTISSGGGYYVVVTNIYGAVTSAVANVTVVSNLDITAQFPITYTNLMTLYGGTNILGTNYLGSSPTFSVSVVGATPISYQWETNGVAVGGANGPNFTFANCQLGSPTNFSCLMANAIGSVTSQVWSVSYIPTATAPFPQLVLSFQPIGYWRLNEPDDGDYDGNPNTICEDYESGNNAIYTNVYLSGPSYNPITDPSETSAQLGLYAPSASFAGSIGTNIDFTTPAGDNAEFAVAVWANGYNNAQPANAGLVAKGYFYGEEFNIDEGGPVNSLGQNTLRFESRDASGGDHDADSSVDLRVDPGWHYIVGVCDEANGLLSLYVDGQLAGNAAMPVQGGIVNSATVPVMIGARTTSSTTIPPGNNQFVGYLSDVAIYNYALTASQVLEQYNGSGIPPYFIQQPLSSTNADAGGTLVVPTSVGGSQPLTMQWFDVNANSYISGQTSNTLVVPDITASDTYYLTVSNNIDGTGYLTNSARVSVTVYNEKPQIYTDVKSPIYALLGQTTNISATVYGALPLAYQWQFFGPTGWMNLADNGLISGSLTSALTIGNIQGGDAGNYQLVITNVYGATTSSVATLIIPGVLPLTFGNGIGWSANAGATFSSGVLTLTTGTSGNGTFFFQVPQYIGAFEASFTYMAQYDSTYPLADGITFCLQDAPNGASATGSGGGQLGFGGITPSAALQLNIYTGNGLGGIGYAFGYNGGASETTYPGSVNLTNGAVDVSVLYINGQIALTLSNELSLAVFSTNIYVGSIPQDLGSSTAYVGFTGSFGGDTSIQTVQNFQFVSIPPQAIQTVGTNAIITWPGSVVADYMVQQNANLETTNWVTVTNAIPILTNGLNQATVPTGGSNQEFYRLILSQP